MHFFLYFICGLFVGILSFLFGIGGGVFIVPLLLFLGIEPKYAVGTSSVVTFFNAFFSFLQHTKIKKRSCSAEFLQAPNLSLIFSGVASSFLGALCARFVHESLLLLLFASFLWLVVFLFFKRNSLKNERHEIHSALRSSPRVLKKFLAVGCITGFCSGLFGVGGGVILIPLLVLWLRYSFSHAVFTCVQYVLVVSFFASLSHVFYRHIVWPIALFLVLGGILGVFLSKRLLYEVRVEVVQKLFVVFLLALSFYLLFKAAVFSDFFRSSCYDFIAFLC